MAVIQCRHFNGYKPCGLNSTCNQECSHKDILETSVLVIHLGAIGAVVRATALLKRIREKYPKAQLTWITDKPSDQLLRNHPDIDRVLNTDSADILSLSALEFDVALVIDKSLKASGVLKATKAKEIFGFRADPKTGAILPATYSAKELWEIGLDNHKKFHGNRKSEVQLMVEALELSGQASTEYNLPLTKIEIDAQEKRKNLWTINPNQPIIGINTGCSAVIPYKKLSVEGTRTFIQKLINKGFENLVLLGGPEDTGRNLNIGRGLPVFQSPTELGLRDGLVSVGACDIVVTGDSLGMHMAISQKKYVIAWFGPTCAHEIELYGRGKHILTQASCSPCWKRTCEKTVMCYDQVDFDQMTQAIGEQFSTWAKSLSFKQPSSEI